MNSEKILTGDDRKFLLIVMISHLRQNNSWKDDNGEKSIGPTGQKQDQERGGPVGIATRSSLAPKKTSTYYDTLGARFGADNSSETTTTADIAGSGPCDTLHPSKDRLRTAVVPRQHLAIRPKDITSSGSFWTDRSQCSTTPPAIDSAAVGVTRNSERSCLPRPGRNFVPLPPRPGGTRTSPTTNFLLRPPPTYSMNQ